MTAAVMVPLLVKTDTEDTVLANTTGVVARLMEGSIESIQTVLDVEEGICKRLIKLMRHPHEKVSGNSLRVIGNVSAGNETQTMQIMQHNVLPTLLSLLETPQVKMRKDVFWTISNIAANNIDCIQAIIDEDVVPTMIEMYSDEHDDVRNEIVWGIANAIVSGSDTQVEYFVSQGSLQLLCGHLSEADSDGPTVYVCLESLHKTLVPSGDEDNSVFATRQALLLETRILDKLESWVEDDIDFVEDIVELLKGDMRLNE